MELQCHILMFYGGEGFNSTLRDIFLRGVQYLDIGLCQGEPP